MTVMSDRQLTPSILRALTDLLPEHQVIVAQQYKRLLPVLLLLMRPRDILERNRTWPGISPKGKQATRYLTVKWARQARVTIQSYATESGEDPDLLWQLCRAYFRYGPIGLIDVLPYATAIADP
jgi:hypothetical protein